MASILNVDQINNAAGTTALTIDSSGAVSFPNSKDVYNVWYIDTSKSLSSGYTQLTAASDWTEESAKIGSSMSFDNGTGKWTFPSTGIWEVTWHTTFSTTGNTNYLGGIMYTTTDDGSNFTHYASSYGNATSGQYTSARSTLVFDVTDTSTHKIRFGVEMAGAGCTLLGGSIRRSYGIFKRLGDT